MGMADRIKERRLALGLTQEELAQKVGLQKSAIAKYENGRVENMKRSVIAKMADALECSPAYLMGFDEEDEPTYYLNPEAAEIAEEIFENDELKILFDATRNVPPEDLQFVIKMVEALKEKGSDNDD